MEVLEKEPNKVNVVPSPGLTAQREGTVSQKAFATEKLCFQPGVPVLWQVQEILLRDLVQLPVQISESQPFKVRAPVGFMRYHCAECMAAGFGTAVPV